MPPTGLQPAAWRLVSLRRSRRYRQRKLTRRLALGKQSPQQPGAGEGSPAATPLLRHPRLCYRHKLHRGVLPRMKPPRTLVTERLYFGLDPIKLRAATGRALARVVG